MLEMTVVLWIVGFISFVWGCIENNAAVVTFSGFIFFCSLISFVMVLFGIA